MQRVKSAITKIKIKNLFSPLIFLLLIIPATMYKLFMLFNRRSLWLVCEDGHTARDNGYHFFKYVRMNHQDDKCFYAIDKKAADYEKVKHLGNIVQYGSLKHWFYYLSATLNISNQKSGNPDYIFFYIIHVKLGLIRNRVFLQHGITKDDSNWLYYKNTKFKYLVCGAEEEYEYIKNNFGYKEKKLVLSGFPRWDSLINMKKDNKSILVMPTWRKWLGGEKNSLFKNNDFKKSDYYKKWNSLISNKDFQKFLVENDIILYFYPHVLMKDFLSEFVSQCENIKIVSPENDIQEYFNTCDLLITDYSSVAFDFALLRKPVIYYQFDLEKYRSEQLQEGYFSYEKDGFGPALREECDVIKQSKEYIKKGLSSEYATRIEKFFGNCNNKNCSSTLYERLTSDSGASKVKEEKKLLRTNIGLENIILFLALLSCFCNVFSIELGFMTVIPLMIMGPIVFIFRMVTHRRTRPSLSAIEVFFLLFMAIAAAEAPFSFDPTRCFTVLCRVAIVIFSIFQFRYLAYSMDRKKVEQIFTAVCLLFLVVSLILYVYSLIELGFQFEIANTRTIGIMVDRKMPRLASIASIDPNNTAIFCAIPLAFFAGKKRYKITDVIGILGFSTLIALTVSRGAVIAMAGLLLVTLFRNGQPVKKRILTFLGIAVAFAVASTAVNLCVNSGKDLSWRNNDNDEPVLVASIGKYYRHGDLTIIGATSNGTSIIDRLQNAISDGGSGRMKLWQNAFNTFLDHPVTGIGIGNFMGYNKKVYKRGQYAHNTYLEILAETGIVAAPLFLLAIIFACAKSFKKRRKSPVAMYILAFLLPAILFLTVFQHEVLYIAFLFVFMSLDASSKERNESSYVTKKENFSTNLTGTKNRKTIKCSIIIPTYNNEKYLRESIFSLKIQNTEDFEAIIIDDGSDDDTIEYTQSVCLADNRFKLIKRKHLGPNMARMAGINVASGKYTIFLDSDDFLREDSISTLISIIEKENADIVHFGIKRFPSGEIFNPITPVEKDGYYMSESEIVNKLVDTYQLNSINNQIYKTELLKDINAFNSGISYGEDLMVNLEIHEKSRKIFVVNEPFYIYRVNENSSTKNTDCGRKIKNLEERVIVSNEVIAFAYRKAKSDSDRVKAVLSQYNMVKHAIIGLCGIKFGNKEQLTDALSAILKSKEYEKFINHTNRKELIAGLKKKPILYRIKNKKMFLAMYDRKVNNIVKCAKAYNRMIGK